MIFFVEKHSGHVVTVGNEEVGTPTRLIEVRKCRAAIYDDIKVVQGSQQFPGRGINEVIELVPQKITDKLGKPELTLSHCGRK
ncbi:MAG: hypothetical protein GKR94_01070 [Gammaproteobacteria bacterium]|nr:hypothetical protein [Gammaproteobacteria bacterium]